MDSETEGLDCFRHDLRLIQIGDLRHGWAIPHPDWTGFAREIITNYEGDLVAHNASFDWKFLHKRAGITIPWNRIHDTITLAALDDPTRIRGLKPLAAMLVDRHAAAGERALAEGMRRQGWNWATVPLKYPAYWAYAALDPTITCHLWQYLYPRVNTDCPQVYDLECAVNRICTKMMMKGLHIDRPYITKNIERLTKFSDEARQWLAEAHAITNPLSARQISAAIEMAGWRIEAVTVTGLPKVDKETLSGIRDGPGVPAQAQQIAKYVLAVRHTDKIIGSYLENFLETADSDDLIHASIQPLAARTSRMSIRDPALQTLHRDDKVVRGAFIPREGQVFLSVDAEQVELRVSAHLSGDEALIEAFAEADKPGGLDFFSGVASQIFHDKVRKGDPRRNVAKAVCYCYLFGGGLEKMAQTAGVSTEQMKPIREAFLTRFPGLGQLARQTEMEARSELERNGSPAVRTLLGRRLPVDADKIYSGLNYRIQGHAAEILKQGIINLEAAGFGEMLLLPIHDECLLEIPAEDAEDLLKVAEDTLNDQDHYAVPIKWQGEVMKERWCKDPPQDHSTRDIKADTRERPTRKRLKLCQDVLSVLLAAAAATTTGRNVNLDVIVKSIYQSNVNLDVTVAGTAQEVTHAHQAVVVAGTTCPHVNLDARAISIVGKLTIQMLEVSKVQLIISCIRK